MKAFTLTLFSLFAVGVAQGQEPRLATLSQQRMCADQAKRAFQESDASKPSKVEKMSRMLPAEYTSHYDAKVNVCYIMVRESNIFDHPDGQTFSNSMLVYDAFEGRLYANYMWFSKKDKKYWEVPPVSCSVKPRGQDEIVCKSSEEFERLIDKHFGIGM